MGRIELFNMCLIENTFGEVLVQKRKRGMSGHTFPGGKVLLNESVEESVIREVREETGLDIVSPCFHAVVSFYDMNLQERRQIFLFKANMFCGELIDENDEGVYFWSNISDFLQLPLVDGMDEFIKAYSNDQQEWHYNC